MSVQNGENENGKRKKKVFLYSDDLKVLKKLAKCKKWKKKIGMPVPEFEPTILGSMCTHSISRLKYKKKKFKK